MPALRVNDVEKSIESRILFSSVSFTVELGDCIGVIGANGCGKSTLLRLIVGLDQSDSGEVSWEPGLYLGYLSQTEHHEGSMRSYLRSKAPLSDGEVIALASGFGLDKHHLDRPFAAYSGGERTRAGLAAISTCNPDFFILDEPTNHLDIDGVTWLESYLLDQRRSRRGVIVVSHDRELLTRVCTHILEIEDGLGRLFPGDYSVYLEQKERERKNQSERYETATRKVERLREALERRKAQARSIDGGPKRGRDFYSGKSARLAKGAVALERRIDRLLLERPEKPKDAREIRLRLEADQGRHRRVLWMNGVAKQYGGRTLFHDVQLELARGERLALVGPNGCGKSTLIRIILGLECPDQGEVRLAGRRAYMRQGRDDLCDKSSVLEALEEVESDETILRTLLACLGFPGDRVFQTVGTLSPGERTRVAIAKLVLDRTDLLILDEPTNHLDLPSREAIETALSTYPGAVIFATHDRAFLRLADKALRFRNGRVILGAVDEEPDQSPGIKASLTDEERLVLENRVAQLGARLSDESLLPDERQALEKEYLTTVRALRNQS